jgi:hypothetical protein
MGDVRLFLGRVPEEILFTGMPGSVARVSPLPPDVAEEIWTTEDVPLDPSLVPAHRLALASPLENLLRHLRGQASAGPSAAA